jgi:hypothetical protein
MPSELRHARGRLQADPQPGEVSRYRDLSFIVLDEMAQISGNTFRHLRMQEERWAAVLVTPTRVYSFRG